MALIKCPECGKDVSTAAEACPHCGFPIKSNAANKQKAEDFTKPLDESWLDDWKKKPGRGKIALTVVYLANLVLLILFIVLLATGYDQYYAYALPMTFVLGFASIFTLSFLIAGLICMKYKIIDCDGYHAIAIAGFWNNFLVIENKVFEKGHNRHLDGIFPNGKHVKADFAFWDSSIRLSINSESYRVSEK